MHEERADLTRSSANPAVTLSLPGSDIPYAKRAMAAEIMKALDAHQWSTRKAEQETGVNHADLTRIRRANVSRYSLERLIAILQALGKDVELSVHVQSRSLDNVA